MLLWLWKHAVAKAAAHSKQQHQYAHCAHHMDVDRPLPWPLQRAGHLHNRHTRGHKYTHICSSHQTLLILSQGSQQRRDEWWIKARIRAGARDRWAKASTARWCLFIAKANTSLAWLEPCPRRSELSFYQMLMIVFFFYRWQKNLVYSLLLVDAARMLTERALSFYYRFSAWKAWQWQVIWVIAVSWPEAPILTAKSSVHNVD